MIELCSVHKRFREKIILDSVSLQIDRGDVAIICGPSGSGTTTLLRTLNRMEPIDGGDILIHGQSLYDAQPNIGALPARVGLVFQHGTLFSHLTALDNIVMPLVKVKRLHPLQARQQALALLDQFGLAARAFALPDELSVEERQRVAIMRCLTLEPTVMLFDEPTCALDRRQRGEVMGTIVNLAQRDITQVIVTHDLDLACAVGSRFFLLEQGRLNEMDRDTLAYCEPVSSGTASSAAPLSHECRNAARPSTVGRVLRHVQALWR